MDQIHEWLEQYRTATHLDQKTAAAERLVTVMAARLHRRIRASCPKDATEDVLQETLVAIVRSLPRFNGLMQFEGWCYRIAARRVADYYENNKRHQAESLSDEEVLHLVENSTESSPLTAQEREQLDEAMELLRQARPPCSEFLNLRFYYGMEHAEIGRLFGKTSAAVGVQIRRCAELAQSLVLKKGAVHA